MAYTSWSVVFEEQPSVAKWNILGTNDASFNDGTGIANVSFATTAVSNPYKFFAYHNTTQSLGSAAQVAFNTEVFDTNSNFSSNTYTVSVAGFYYFKAQMYVSGSTGVFNAVSIYKNGSVLLFGDSLVPATGDISVGAEGLVQCAAGDTIRVYHSNSTTQTVYGQNGLPYYTYFSGFLVSTT